MHKKIQRTLVFLRSDWSAPLILLAVCGLAYGLWLPHLGFFWDAWAMNWIAQTMGGAGLARYFATNRPVWGVIYQLTTPVLGGSPLPWLVAGLLLRWLTGVGVWLIVRLLFPKQKGAALWVSLLFVVYPGFTQQSIGLLYTHFFIVLNAFLFSLAATLAALRKPERFRLYTTLAVLLSLVNLLSMEYFFMLELLRLVLIWLGLGERMPQAGKRLKATLVHALPYLGVFVAAGVWRAFLFPYTENNYRLVVVEQFKAQPLQTALNLAQKALQQAWIASGQAWGQIFNLPSGSDTTLTRRFIPAAVLSAAGVFLWLAAQKGQDGAEKRDNQAWVMLGLGGLAVLLAGFPFWLTDVPFSLKFAFDRFTLPFMLGVSLLLGGLIALLPLGRWVPSALMAGLVALAVGTQIGAGYTFVQDWSAQKDFFWQLTWRAPGLAGNTLVIANETQRTGYSTDNSLTAPLNWIYTPGLKASDYSFKPDELPYLLVYPSIRLGNQSLPALEKGQRSSKDYLVAVFEGSTNRALALYYEPPGCLRVLEPADSADARLPEVMQKAAALSRVDLILTQPIQAAQPMPAIFGAEPPHTWCTFYQKANLARQLSAWQQTAELYEEATRLGMNPNLPAERLPFIEAYARLGKWQTAQDLTLQSASEKPNPREAVCRLWQTLLSTTPASAERLSAWDEVRVKLDCTK